MYSGLIKIRSWPARLAEMKVRQCKKPSKIIAMSVEQAKWVKISQTGNGKKTGKKSPRERGNITVKVESRETEALW